MAGIKRRSDAAENKEGKRTKVEKNAVVKPVQATHKKDVKSKKSQEKSNNSEKRSQKKRKSPVETDSEDEDNSDENIDTSNGSEEDETPENGESEGGKNAGKSMFIQFNVISICIPANLMRLPLF